jgi:ATP-dependent Clp protease ATP-binding subunit ClpA
MRRFQNIFIDEPTESETLMILEGIKDAYEEYHNVVYPKEILEGIVKKCSRFLISRKFPDKAIDVLVELGARARSKVKTIINADMLDDIIKDMSGINHLTTEELRKTNLNYPELKSYYLRFLKGESSANNIVVIEVPVDSNPERLYEDLAAVFKLRSEMILDINLEEYLETNAINNLIGSPAGYVGYETGGILSEHLIKYPLSAVYLKGLSQANFAIQNYLKKMLKRKTITDNKGRTILLTNTIFILEKDQMTTETAGFLRKKDGTPKSKSLADIALSHIVFTNNHQSILSKYQSIGFKEGFILSFSFNEIKDQNALDIVIYRLLLEDPGPYVVNEKDGQYEYIKA